MPESASTLSAQDLARLGDYLVERLSKALGKRRETSQRPLWTEEQVSEYLGVSVKTLYRMRTAEEIPFVRLKGEGKREIIRYVPRQIETWARAGGCKVRGRRRLR